MALGVTEIKIVVTPDVPDVTGADRNGTAGKPLRWSS
jgi:hypothetical protein